MKTMEFLKNIPVKNKDRVFLIDAISGEKLTFGQLYNEACKLSADLSARGFVKGDRIAIVLSNSALFVRLYFGCLYSGFVAVPVSPTLSFSEMDFIISRSKIKLVITSPETRNKVSFESLAKHGISSLCMVADMSLVDKKKVKDIWDIFSLGEAKGFIPFRGATERDDLAIIYTSGTTAQPKGVIHSISDLVENGRLFARMMGINSSNRFINILQMTYLGGYYNLLLLPYVAESSVVLAPAFDAVMAVTFWKKIIEHEVNTLWLVPTIMSILMEVDRDEKGISYCKDNIKLTLCGTAPLPLRLRLDFEQKYGVSVHENYGLSETLFISTNTPSAVVENGSAGQVLPGVHVKVVDGDFNEVPGEDIGEIFVRTPYIMRGYYLPESEEVAEASCDDWFPTGDLGIVTASGNVHITGRKKDLIIRGGVNVSPVEIEGVLHKNKDVLECAVVGIPHKILGEDIIAIIRIPPSAEFKVTRAELINICREYLSHIKQPTHIIELPEFPHTSSGKIQKNKIREWLKKKMGNENMPAPSLPSPRSRMSDNKRRAEFRPSKVVADSVQAMSIMINTLIYEKRATGADIIVLSLGEAFFDIPLFPFDDLPSPSYYHYSHSRGIPELREKLSKYFLSKYDVSFDSTHEIIITAGSKIAIHMALMAILNPGDEAIIYEPAWVSYPEQVKLCYGTPVHLPYYEGIMSVEKYITDRTKVIIINNPHNPTGKIFNLEELSHLYKIAQKYNLFILSDEAYSDFVLNDEEFISLGNLDREKKYTIICNSISKNLGISGWRLGYVISNADLINEILKVNQHLITCPATILEYYIAKHFFEIIEITKPQIFNVVKTRQLVAQYMDKIGLTYLPGTATFYFFVSIGDSFLSSEEFCLRLLDKSNVGAVPGIGYGKSCDRFIRISIGAEGIERIKKGLDIIKALIEETSFSSQKCPDSILGCYENK